MDGDIKKQSPKQKTRAKQKSTTLSRKSVSSKHRSSTPLGKPLKSKTGRGDNPFAPPEGLVGKLRMRYMLGFGASAMLLFGASMFFLGASFSDNEGVNVTDSNGMKTVRRPASGDTPRCEVVWQKDSPVTSPGFTLEFDRELPIGFWPLFVVDNRAIQPVNGVHTLSAETPTEYSVTVVQDSDVVTDEILCEYGPVLIGSSVTS